MLIGIQKNTHKQFAILIFLGIFFFFIYSFLNFGNPLAKFTWPDETANYFFIKNYIENSDFSVAEPLNEIAGNLIKPRSFNVYQDNLVPGSFLGMLLIYGLIGKIIGVGLMKFLTPLLAVLAVLFFYKILLKIFSPKIAFLSALLFFVNPAWWYYANFSMLPNIAFLSFLIMGIYWLLRIDKEIKQNNILFVILGSFFIALALIIRTNEFLWILGILMFLLIVYFKKIKWQHVILFFIVIFLVFLPIFYYNQATYGDYLSFGYLRLEQGDNLITQLPTEFKTSTSNLLNFAKFLALPFGFHPKVFLLNFYNYYIFLFSWLFIPFVLGVFCLIKYYNKKAHGVFFLIFITVSLYLLVYYGSWLFEDLMTLQLNKIGISYVRYFLPIYILALPFVAIFYFNLINYFRNRKFKILLSLLLIVSFLYFTINIVYLSGHDNLIKSKQNIKDYNKINQEIINLTKANAIIISQRSDKIFFPERNVIGRFQLEEDISYLINLLNAKIPLYYYAYEGDEYIYELNYFLEEFGLVLIPEMQATEKETLYAIRVLKELDEESYE